MDGSSVVQWLQGLLFGSRQGAQLLSVMIADPGFGAPPSLETIAVLSLGIFLGSIAMGICGFGTAIIHLCTWALAGALGFNAGPLKLAVIACSCALTISMVPFFFLARATQHAIRPLAISIPIAKAVAAPLGAAVLKLLPARQMEAVVAGVMLSLMLLINRQQLASWVRGVQQWCCSSSCGRCAAASRVQQRKDCTSAVDVRAAEDSSELRLALLEADDTSDDDDDDDDGSDASLLSLLSSDGSADDALLHSAAAAAGYAHHYNYKQHHSADGAVLIQDVNPDQDQDLGYLDLEGGGCLQDPYLDLGKAADHSMTDGDHIDQLELYASQPLLLSDDAIGSSRSESDQAEEVHVEEALVKHSFWTLFAIGAVAGLATGLLGGATGISGPPMMLMYAYLNASKSAVRGTNAVMAMVQDQLIGYYMFGMLRWADRWLYLAAAVCGAAGLLLGHLLQKLMDQQHFRSVMTGLMLLCFVLMSLSAAGVMNLAE